MDEIYKDPIFKDVEQRLEQDPAKQKHAGPVNLKPVFKVEEEVDEAVDISVMNINREMDRLRQDQKGQMIIMEAPKKDEVLEKAVREYLKPMLAENFRIKGKTMTDKITDPPRSRWRTIREKRQEDRRKDRLKAQFRQQHGKNAKTPHFDNTTHKFRKYAQKYNALVKDTFAPRYKERLENEGYDWDQMKCFIPLVQELVDLQQPGNPVLKTKKRKFPETAQDRQESDFFVECMTADRQTREFYFGKMVEKTLAFHFTAAIASEDYMRAHYLELRLAVEKSIQLPEILKNDEEYWNKLSPNMKETIELQAETACTFQRVLEEYAHVHNVDMKTGEFFVSGPDTLPYYNFARSEYQKTMRNNYRFMGKMREKLGFGMSLQDEQDMKRIANDTGL